MNLKIFTVLALISLGGCTLRSGVSIEMIKSCQNACGGHVEFVVAAECRCLVPTANSETDKSTDIDGSSK